MAAARPVRVLSDLPVQLDLKAPQVQKVMIRQVRLVQVVPLVRLVQVVPLVPPGLQAGLLVRLVQVVPQVPQVQKVMIRQVRLAQLERLAQVERRVQPENAAQVPQVRLVRQDLPGQQEILDRLVPRDPRAQRVKEPRAQPDLRVPSGRQEKVRPAPLGPPVQPAPQVRAAKAVPQARLVQLDLQEPGLLV